MEKRSRDEDKKLSTEPGQLQCAKHPVVSRMNAEVASLHGFPVAEMVDNKRKLQVPYRNESDATALTGGVSAATGCE